jgi:hypothetical protein
MISQCTRDLLFVVLVRPISRERERLCGCVYVMNVASMFYKRGSDRGFSLGQRKMRTRLRQFVMLMIICELIRTCSHLFGFCICGRSPHTHTPTQKYDSNSIGIQLTPKSGRVFGGTVVDVTHIKLQNFLTKRKSYCH